MNPEKSVHAASTIAASHQTTEGLLVEFQQLVNIASHGIRDPLRMAHEEIEHLEIDPNSLLAKKLEGANKQIDNVITMIGILKEYSSYVSQKAAFEVVDCNQVVEQAKQKLQEKIEARQVSITIEWLPTLRGNAAYLEQLFIHLFDNAIKFNEQAIPVIYVSASEDVNQYIFSVKDNGIGLDEVYRQLVFMLMQQLEPDPENNSFGAGLAIAKKIVEIHGGNIWFTSDGETGTTFHFSIRK